MARILIIEDDADLRDVLVTVLRRRGHEVDTANEGEEALARMRSALPDVVLLDLRMPGMNGWEFRLEQRRDPVLAQIPVIAMSADKSPQASAVDADLCLAKPFD